MGSTMPFSVRLVAFMCSRLIFGSSIYATIRLIDSRKSLLEASITLPNLGLACYLMQKDVFFQAMFAGMLYGHLDRTRLAETTIHQLLRETISLEKEYAKNYLQTHLLGCPAEGTSADVEPGPYIDSYIDYLGNTLLLALGMQPVLSGNTKVVRELELEPKQRSLVEDVAKKNMEFGPPQEKRGGRKALKRMGGPAAPLGTLEEVEEETAAEEEEEDAFNLDEDF